MILPASLMGGNSLYPIDIISDIRFLCFVHNLLFDACNQSESGLNIIPAPSGGSLSETFQGPPPKLDPEGLAYRCAPQSRNVGSGTADAHLMTMPDSRLRHSLPQQQFSLLRGFTAQLTPGATEVTGEEATSGGVARDPGCISLAIKAMNTIHVSTLS